MAVDYPESLDVRPLTTWPGTPTPAHARRPAPFRAGLSATKATLRTELLAIGAVRPILEVAIEPRHFRQDGRPRADARATHPGVVLSLPHTRDLGPLRFAADRFTDWTDNLRAIALGLEALRKVDRYGITRRGEQFAGFRALPPGATPMPAAMTVDRAAAVVAELAGMGPAEGPRLLEDREALRHAYRHAAREHHPDAGGRRATWDLLEEAKRVLDEHAA